MPKAKAARPPKKKAPWKPKIPFARMKASSKRLVLRPWRAVDFPLWIEGNNSLLPKQNPWDFSPPPPEKCTRVRFALRVKDQQKSARIQNTYPFGIFERKTGRWLGGIDFFIISPKIRCANLGYFVLNTQWGKGIAPEAAKLALDIAFRQLDLLRVEASCELKNKASARVAVKAGMYKEGMRLKYPIPSGLKDLFVFGMNAEDWKKR